MCGGVRVEVREREESSNGDGQGEEERKEKEQPVPRDLSLCAFPDRPGPSLARSNGNARTGPDRVRPGPTPVLGAISTV
jgi:hypothetical protein